MNEEDVTKVLNIIEDRFRQPHEKVGLIWDGNFAYMMAYDICSMLIPQDHTQKILELAVNVTTEVVTKDTAKLIGDKMMNIINDYPQDNEDRVGRLGQLAEDLINNKLPGEE